MMGNLKSMISEVKGSKAPIESIMQIEKNKPIYNEAEGFALPMLKKSISDPIEPAKGDIE